MKKIILSIILLGGVNANAQQLLEVLRPHTTSINLPPNITLGGGTTFIASIYDSNYLPYTIPTTPADWSSDGAGTDKLIDYQGKITEEGQTIYIPITVTGSGSSIIPAYTTAPITIPSEKTEDGQSRQVVISWAEQTNITSSSKYITATLKTLSGTLNVKKLDINRGVGNDYKGVLLADIIYPSSSSDTTATATYEVRAIPGIPDRKFGELTNNKLEHQFLYIPIEVFTKTGEKRIWLNNNLGADYTNIDSEYFNPSQQAISYNDIRSFGSLFQWQRPSDGHELIKYGKNYNDEHLGVYQGVYNSLWNDFNWTPDHPNFILTEQRGYYGWVMYRYNDISYAQQQGAVIRGLWGKEGKNNPCPYGYYVPTVTDYIDLYNNPILNLAFNPIRHPYEINKLIHFENIEPQYWTSSSLQLENDSGMANTATYYNTPEWHSAGLPIRCIADN